MTADWTDDTAGIVPRFEAAFGRSGIHVHDPIEDASVLFLTNADVEPTPIDTDPFVYPVSSAVQIELTSLKTPHAKPILVRDADGDIVEEVTPQDDQQSFPEDTYLLEFSSFSIKLYGLVTSGFHIVPRTDEMQILFDPDTTFGLGARSRHMQPARTVTTTRSPEGIMEAVSLFGNAMKTWSPERTFGSLRGHPPLVEYGETSAFDNGLTPPDTGIEVHVPADYEWVYPATPLAYWMGATLTPGDPAIVANGDRYPLGQPAGYSAPSPRQAFEQHVRDLFQYSFLFEVAMRRTYGHTPPPRDRVEAAETGLDLDSLYEEPIGSRVQTYLDTVSFSTLEETLDRPEWQLTANMEPTAERGTVLPFLARDLAVVRAMPEPRLARLEAEGDSGASPFSAGPAGASVGETGDTMTRSSNDTGTAATARERVIRSLPESTSFSQAWVGAGFAEGAATVSKASYLQRLENLAEEKTRTSVDVIVNDASMTGEEKVLDAYGSRDQLEFDVTLHEQLSTAELASVLEHDTDFVHYVGHVTESGFECADGYLDVSSLGSVGVDMFVLNACASYEQGQQLVEKGAIAGVVTLKEVISSAATVIGHRFAQLLNYGFPIGAATDLIRETKLLAQQYSVVGDANATLAQPTGGTTSVEVFEMGEDGELQVSQTAYATWNLDVGALFFPGYGDRRVTIPSKFGPVAAPEEDVAESLERWTFPIVAGGKFFWSDELTLPGLRSVLESE